MEELINLVSNVGFPIACCVVLFMQQNKLTKTLTEISITMSGLLDRITKIENHLDMED